MILAAPIPEMAHSELPWQLPQLQILRIYGRAKSYLQRQFLKTFQGIRASLTITSLVGRGLEGVGTGPVFSLKDMR